jgi:adenylate kinase family enzyme
LPATAVCQHEAVQRVVVLGPGGAGKSVLATAISRRTGLPVVHMDVLFWRPGWKPAARDRALHDLEAAIAGDRWIVDGDFLPADGEHADSRFDRADTVIFLDLPRRTCLWRVLTRRVRDRGRARPDLPEGCSEGFDARLLRWIWSYPKVDRPRVLALLGRLDHHLAVHRLRSPSEVERLLETL